MRQHVDAGDIHRPERRAAGTAERRSGNRVDLLDRVLAGRQHIERARDAVQADVVADEVRRVLRHHHALAEDVIAEPRHRRDDGGIGVGGRDDLEQAQVARRIEEVRAEPVPAEIVRSAFGDRRDRDARGVRADDRSGPALLVDLREQLLLDVEPLDDRFHDPVGLGDEIEVRVEAAGRDELVSVGRELRIGFQLARLLEPLLARRRR